MTISLQTQHEMELDYLECEESSSGHSL